METFQVNVTTRTLKRRFQKWELRRRLPTYVADAAKKRIQVLFFDVGLEDHDMLTVLHKEGFNIGKYTLVRLRFELGLRRRVRGVQQCQEADQLIRGLVAQELEKGVIDGYGRRYLHTHFRQRGIIVARDRLFEAYRTMNYEAVERRKRDLQRHRGEYLVPGPNFVWSIDGYCKLRPYGVEILSDSRCCCQKEGYPAGSFSIGVDYSYVGQPASILLRPYLHESIYILIAPSSRTHTINNHQFHHISHLI